MQKSKTRISSRLQSIEDKKNRKQAALFIVLSIGFLVLLVLIGLPFFEKAIIWLGDRNETGAQGEKNDLIPPIAPKLISNYEATSSGKVTIRGYSEAGSKVVLFENNNKVAEIISDGNGAFEFSDIDMMDGENIFYALAYDFAGNKSSNSAETKILYDNQAPELEIFSPSDGDNFYDDEREIVVSGKTDIDANVRVNGYVVIVDTEGNFVKKIRLSKGENEIEVKAYDKALNEKQEKITVKYYD